MDQVQIAKTQPQLCVTRCQASHFLLGFGRATFDFELRSASPSRKTVMPALYENPQTGQTRTNPLQRYRICLVTTRAVAAP